MINKAILYAEDEEDDAMFLRRAFTLAGVVQKLVVVPDGQEAIDYCSGGGRYANSSERVQPCLLLLDLNMPKKSGLEVLNWVRRESSASTLPIIVLTSSLLDADIQRAYMQGANAYLVKPSDPSELVTLAKAIKEFWLTYNRVPAQFGNFSGAGGPTTAV